MQELGKKGKRKGFVGLTCILDCVMAVQLRLMWRLTLCKDFQEEEGGGEEERRSDEGVKIMPRKPDLKRDDCRMISERRV